jgi:hypothetical protein
MRHLLAIVACLAVTGSAVDAAPRHARHAKVAKKAKAKVTHRKKAAPPAKQHVAIKDDDDIEIDEDAIEIDETPAAAKIAKTDTATKSYKSRKADKADETDDSDEADEADDADDAADADDADEADDADDEVAAESDEDESEEIDEAPALTKHASLRRAKKWNVAIGPYLWASSVDAKVLLGSESIGAGVDFFQITKHAKYGIPVLLEARYGRFTVLGDMMYGVIGVNGMKELGPVNVQLDGTIKSLQFDGFGGVTALGNSESKVALEARGGVRYQRTVIAGSLGTAEMPAAPIGMVTASTDWLVGARAFVRPWRRVFFTGQADIGVAGTSARTWSAAADASVRLPYALISVGYRTMTTDNPYVSVVMHGPRIAIQASF